MHTDASSVTLNINLNLPDEKFSGSEVDFHDASSGELNRLSFKPGIAVLHKGSVAHRALASANKQARWLCSLLSEELKTLS